VDRKKGSALHYSDLEDLDKKLRKAKSTSKSHNGQEEDDRSPSALGLAFRVATELVIAVAFGVGAGWALDRWLGTSPWLLLVFIFLGMGAGILNVYRIAMPKQASNND